MNPNALYRPFVIGPTSAMELYGSLWEPSLFLPVMWETERLIKGLLLYCDEEGLYTDAPEDIEAALNVLREQLAVLPMTREEVCGLPPSPWGALFREAVARIEERQGPGLPPPPWEFQIDIRDGEYILQFRTQEGE